MTKTEQAAFTAVVKLMKHYRSEAERLRGEPKPMTDDRVKEILRLPSKDLVELCISLANLTRNELTAINHCVRLGYTQEETAEIMERSRNAVQLWYSSGMKKLRTAWTGVFWIEKL